MNEQEQKHWANDRKLAHFYESLESILKRHNPVEYILAIAIRLHEISRDGQRWLQIPPFRAVHSIEACCAYGRKHSRDPVSLNRIHKAMNVYHAHPDPMQHDVLTEKGVLPFLLLAHREQIELQYSHSWDDFGRAMTLFAQPNSLKYSSKAFYVKHNLTPLQWIQLCFLSVTVASKNPIGLFPTDSIFVSIRELGLTQSLRAEAVRSYFTLVSRTPDQIGERFRHERSKLPRYLHSSIRSVLLDTPLINVSSPHFSGEHMLLLLQDLLFRQGNDGLYRLMKGLDNFDNEIGAAFESYVGEVIINFDGRTRCHGENDLKKSVTGKVCDYLIELRDEILLIETKSVSFTKTVLTDKSIKEETSTRRIAEAITQLYTTAHDLGNGRFDHLGVDKSKPVTGIVVTLGEIPLVNLGAYFDTYIMTLASPKLESPIYPSQTLLRRPIAISVRTLEQLVMACNALNTSPLALYDQKAALHDALAGDWNTYVNGLVNDNLPLIKSLPFMRPRFADLMKSLGATESIVNDRMITE